MNQSQILEFIKHYLSFSLDSELIISGAIDNLWRFIPNDRALFVWLNDYSYVTNVYDTVFWNANSESVSRSSDATAFSLKIDDPYFNTPTHNALSEKVNAGMAIQSEVLNNKGKVAGIFILIRSQDNSPFLPNDRELLATITRTLSENWKTSKCAYRGLMRLTNMRGLVTLSPEGALLNCCKDARRMLILLSNTRLDYRVIVSNQLSESIKSALVKECDQQLASNNSPQIIRMSNCWGTFELSAHCVHCNTASGEQQCGVMILHFEPTILTIWRKCLLMGLTPTQMKICVLIPEGLSRPEVAERLGISHNTVSDHMSNLYERLDVSSRQELAQKILSFTPSH